MSGLRSYAPPVLTLKDDHDPEGRTTLRAPSPGLWTGTPRPGTLVRPGDTLGSITLLGVAHALLVPASGEGLVREVAGDRRSARVPVSYGEVLVVLDPVAALGTEGASGSGAEARGRAASSGALVVRAPSSGRFYARPSPGAPAFVEVGQVLVRGAAIGLLEVMKTFHRLEYQDPALPERARVVEVLCQDGQDVDAGTALLRIEADA